MAETPQQSDSGGGMLAGMIVGAMIGAALALLYTPKSGKAMRADLAQRLDEMRETVDQTTRSFAETAKERLDEMKKDLAVAVEGARVTAAEHAAELSRRVDLE